MTFKLSIELSQALAERAGQPLPVEDPVTNAQYVVVQRDLYDRLQSAIDYDASEPDVRAFYPAFASAVHDDLDSPGMDYDDEATPSSGQP